MNLTDALSSISILAAILTFFFGFAHEGIVKSLDITPVDREKEDEREKQRKEVKRALFVRAVPIFIGSIILCFVCLPQTIDIFQTSDFEPWNFDLAQTLFVLLEIGLSFLLLWTLLNVYQLSRKIYKFRNN